MLSSSCVFSHLSSPNFEFQILHFSIPLFQQLDESQRLLKSSSKLIRVCEHNSPGSWSFPHLLQSKEQLCFLDNSALHIILYKPGKLWKKAELMINRHPAVTVNTPRSLSPPVRDKWLTADYWGLTQLIKYVPGEGQQVLDQSQRHR